MFLAANHHRMISEGSCDTENWSNDVENSALSTGINYTLAYIQIENTCVTNQHTELVVFLRLN